MLPARRAQLQRGAVRAGQAARDAPGRWRHPGRPRFRGLYQLHPAQPGARRCLSPTSRDRVRPAGSAVPGDQRGNGSAAVPGRSACSPRPSAWVACLAPRRPARSRRHPARPRHAHHGLGVAGFAGFAVVRGLALTPRPAGCGCRGYHRVHVIVAAVTPDRLRGRVMAADYVVGAGGGQLGNLEAAPVSGPPAISAFTVVAWSPSWVPPCSPWPCPPSPATATGRPAWRQTCHRPPGRAVMRRRR